MLPRGVAVDQELAIRMRRTVGVKALAVDVIIIITVPLFGISAPRDLSGCPPLAGISAVQGHPAYDAPAKFKTHCAPGACQQPGVCGVVGVETQSSVSALGASPRPIGTVWNTLNVLLLHN